MPKPAQTNHTQGVLLVDDDPGFLEEVRRTLHTQGITNITTLQDSSNVFHELANGSHSVLILDWVMPGLSGADLLPEIVRQYPYLPVIILTGVSDLENVVNCIKQGAYDYIIKSRDDNRLVSVVQKAFKSEELASQNKRLTGYLQGQPLEEPDCFSDIITCSDRMQALFKIIESMRHSRQPVLITGETGAGKELIAQAIHRTSSLRGPMITVNVAGLDDNMFSDTLFGHKKGAFTGATDTHGNRILFNYDAAHNLTSIDSPTAGRLATLSYDAGGSISKLTDRDGRSVNYVVDAKGNLVEITGPLGEKTSFVYDQLNGFNRLLKKTDPAGHITSIEYKTGQLVVAKVAEPGGTARTFDYDFKGYTFYSTDLRGVVTVFKLDKDGKITSITKNGQTVKTVSYGTDRSETATDGLNNSTTIKRNERDDPILITDAEGNQTRIEYNSLWKISKITDPLGNVTLFGYNATQDLTSVTDPEGAITSLGYDSFGNVTSVTRGSSITRYAYDNRGNVTKVTDPLGNETSLGYDAYGFVNKIIDPANNSTSITNDLVGNPTMVEDPLGNKKRYSYDPKGNIAGTTDQLGRSYSYTYDYKDRVTSITDPLGSITRYSYDGDGNLLQQTTNSGTAQEQITSYSYDYLSRLQTVTDPLGNVTSHSYAGPTCPDCSQSAPGPATITDPLGNNSRYSYNRNGKPVQIVDPLGNSTQLLRTALGQVSRITDANNNSTSLGYDKNGRTIRRINATGGVTQLGYDPLGNLSSITDPKGNSTSFSYDLAGRQTKETRPLGQNLTYSYHANGLLKTATDANNNTTTYSYDKAGRLTETTRSDNTKDTYSYDPVGNLIAYTGPGISSSITYDQLNRKTQETVTFGTITKTYSYSYDANGNKQTFTSPEGKTYSYAHNKNNQLTDITTDNKTITLEHQWIRQTKTTLPNNITTSYSYNQNNWLAAIETKQNSSTLSKQQNSFDKTGNITTKTTEQQTISYSYDPLYQLTQAGAESFSYDNNGNRADSTADANNRVTATATATYSYDANGNTTSKTENNNTTQYSYDAANRLTQVTLPNGSSVSYAYDPFNRRISKTANNITTFYLYADEGLIGEYTETGTPKKTYAWLPDSTWGTNPISQTDNGITYYYLNDHLGTPQKLVDESGTVVWAASYDAFGKATVTTNTVSNNLRFPGQYADEETGLHYNWNRYYDPSTGRYTQEDPIGLKGKDYNFYRYVQGNPMNWTDPWGLEKINLFDVTKEPGLFDAAVADIDTNELTIYSHGTNITVNNMTAGQLEKFIRESGKWKPGMNIRLNSCRSAQGQNSIAEELAKRMGVFVTGAEGKVWLNQITGRDFRRPYPAIELIWFVSPGLGKLYPKLRGYQIPNFLAPGRWVSFSPSGSKSAW